MDILTVKAAADLLEVDQKTVYRLIERDGLPAFRVGRQWRLRLSDVEGWIEGQLRVREAPALGESPFEAAAGSAIPFTENSDLPAPLGAVDRRLQRRFVEDVIRRYIPQDRPPSSG